MTTVPHWFGATPEVIGGAIPGRVRRRRIDHQWTGWDGSRWNLTDRSGNSGVILLYDGIDGLLMPEWTHHLDTAETVDGAELTGVSTLSRNPVWPLYVYDQGTSEAWVAYDRKWWASLSEREFGTWTVTAPGANPRHLRCVLKGVEPGLKRDPAAAGWARYAVTLLATDPFWYEDDPDPKEFRVAEPRNFFGGDPLPGPGSGLPYLTPNASVQGDVVSNPGDVASWAEVTLLGPLDPGTIIGVSGRYIVIDRAVPAGSTVHVDTRPRDQVITIDGTEFFPGTLPQYAPIPPGGQVPITVVIQGGLGSVEVLVRPRFRRAW